MLAHFALLACVAFALSSILVAMTTAGQPTGPHQAGRGVVGQYVYWITMPHPTPETAHRLKSPTDYTRESFRQTVCRAHEENGVIVLEAGTFQELHSHGKVHLNCLVRAEKQYRWKKIADWLLDVFQTCVNFAPNIKTWSEGVVYGCVASEHKPREMLDNDREQWAKNGSPTPFEELLPKAWLAPNFTRKWKMTAVAFLDLCKERKIYREDDAWALAERMAEQM